MYMDLKVYSNLKKEDKRFFCGCTLRRLRMFTDLDMQCTENDIYGYSLHYLLSNGAPNHESTSTAYDYNIRDLAKMIITT